MYIPLRPVIPHMQSLHISDYMLRSDRSEAVQAVQCGPSPLPWHPGLLVSSVTFWPMHRADPRLLIGWHLSQNASRRHPREVY